MSCCWITFLATTFLFCQGQVTRYSCLIPRSKSLLASRTDGSKRKTSVVRHSSCKKQNAELQIICFERCIYSWLFGSRHDLCAWGWSKVLEKLACTYQVVIQLIPERDLEQEMFENLPWPVGFSDGELDQRLGVANPFLCTYGSLKLRCCFSFRHLQFLSWLVQSGTKDLKTLTSRLNLRTVPTKNFRGLEPWIPTKLIHLL